MPFPKQGEVEEPLLSALVELGGKAKPRDIYPVVTKYFPELTPDELEERLPNYPSTRRWANLVQWVRQRLVEVDQIDGSERGVWAITVKGRARVSGKRGTSGKNVVHQAANLRDLVNENHDEAKRRLLSEMQRLTPRAFEHFCKELLTQFGFRKVEVTKTSKDGGIDGFGDFRQGVISIRSAFQAKRWSKTPVGRVAIDQFRGAIQGDYDHGVFLTTSRFSRDAVEASVKKGAITILLLDGPAIADLLLERGLGVRRSPLFLYDIDVDFFDISDE